MSAVQGGFEEELAVYFDTDAEVTLDSFSSMAETNAIDQSECSMIVTTIGPAQHVAVFSITEPVPGTIITPLPTITRALDIAGRPYVGPANIEVTA